MQAINKYYNDELSYTVSPSHITGMEIKDGILHLTVIDGIVIEKVEVNGVTVFPKEMVDALITSKPGDLFNRKKANANAKEFVESLGIATPTIHQVVRNLSGGNQQKVAVGKWLAADSDLYIFDEPTKGVDVGAKQDIFRLINEIAKNGKAVIYASCENAELLSLTDRIYVMYSGRIMAELKTSETSEDEIMFYSVGGKKEEAAGA